MIRYKPVECVGHPQSSTMVPVLAYSQHPTYMTFTLSTKASDASDSM